MSLLVCGVRPSAPRLRAVWRYVWLGFPASVALCGGLRAVRPSLRYSVFRTPTLSPLRVFRYVQRGPGRSVLQHCAVLSQGKPCGVKTTGLFRTIYCVGGSVLPLPSQAATCRAKVRYPITKR